MAPRLGPWLYPHAAIGACQQMCAEACGNMLPSELRALRAIMILGILMARALMAAGASGVSDLRSGR